jgi:tRNA dimethylallyltransferase
MSLESAVRSSIVIAGPTAIGKTALALELSRIHPNTYEILSADSIQVYRRFNIGSAKPTPTEQLEIPFHGIDIVDPDKDFTLVNYKDLAVEVLLSIVGRGHIPLIVGGTGLYIRAITPGLGIPDVEPNEAYRKELAAEAAEVGSPILHARLTAVDQASADRIHPNDLKRIIRGLEVFHLTGRTLTAWHAEDQQNPKLVPFRYIVLNRDRDAIYRQIDCRVDAMYESGLIDEVAALRAEGYPPSLKPMTSVGYLQANKIIDGEVALDVGIELTKNATHQYARRQLILFRCEPVTDWINVEGLSIRSVAKSLVSTVLRCPWVDNESKK